MPPSKYTPAMLAPLVRDSLSLAAVLRGLNLKQTGGSQAYIRRLIRDYGLDTSHFLGIRANHGSVHRGGPDKRTPVQILVVRDRPARPEDPHRLRRALCETGLPYQCAVCGLLAEWQGQPLQLQIDHLNGERCDNRAENLRFICPNCHSQTANFGAKNKRRPAQDPPLNP